MNDKRKNNRLDTDKEKKVKRCYGFELVVLALFCFLILFVCGCGGCSNTRIISSDRGSHNVSGCTLPGCGGCLTSGKGCNSCLYSEKIACVSAEPNQSAIKPIAINACDNIYLGSCLGCGSDVNHITCGHLEIVPTGQSGCFYYGGKDNKTCGKKGGTLLIGCDGCKTVSSDDFSMESYLEFFESEHGIN